MFLSEYIFICIGFEGFGDDRNGTRQFNTSDEILICLMIGQ